MKILKIKIKISKAQSLRKKLSRVEEENESLVMQLKKMAMKKGNLRSCKFNLNENKTVLKREKDEEQLPIVRSTKTREFPMTWMT